MFKLRIEKNDNDNRYAVKECFAERDPSVYKNPNDAYDIETLHVLIGRGLLHFDVMPKINSDDDALRHWSNFGRLLTG